MAHLAVVRADLEAGGAGGHEEDGDARIGARGLAGAGEDDEQPGDRRVGDEPLGPADHPLAGVADGAGAQPCRVGAGAGLGEGEGRDDLAGGEPLEPGGLLLVGAEIDEHLPGDAVVGAEHRAQREGRVAELHRQLDVLDEVEAEAAPLLRDREAEEAESGRGRPQVGGQGIGRHDLVLPGHDPGPDELAGRAQDLGEVLGRDLGTGWGWRG